MAVVFLRKPLTFTPKSLYLRQSIAFTTSEIATVLINLHERCIVNCTPGINSGDAKRNGFARATINAASFQ